MTDGWRELPDAARWLLAIGLVVLIGATVWRAARRLRRRSRGSYQR